MNAIIDGHQTPWALRNVSLFATSSLSARGTTVHCLRDNGWGRISLFVLSLLPEGPFTWFPVPLVPEVP